MDIDLSIDRVGKIPLPLQIARRIREALLFGRLHPGDRLPSSRELAERLRVGRMVVVEAYEWLAVEGYTESRRGGGTFISRRLMLPAGNWMPRREPERRTDRPLAAPPAIDFRPGVPALEQFPRKEWRAAVSRAITRMDAASLGYAPVEGSPRLRRAIAEYVSRVRGVPFAPERVIITAGTAQALNLVMRTIEPGQLVAIEDPSPVPVHRLVTLNGARILAVPVDEAGLIVERVPLGRHAPKLLYAVPSHQFPTGVAMSLERRGALVQWAIDANAHIIEDDYDSEFRYDCAPPSALAALDRSERVIYVGTFSKTMFPALRIGFIIAPEAQIDRLLEYKWWTDRCGPFIEQEALTDWLENGFFERHVHRMRSVYAQRRSLVVEGLQRHFGAAAEICGIPAGMHLMFTLRSKSSEADIVSRAMVRGVGVYPASVCRIQTSTRQPSLILGFGNLDAARIKTGLATLAECIQH